MPKIKLNMSSKYTNVTRLHNELDTGHMAGCVTVIVHGFLATRAQHCYGGFDFLDKAILDGIGTVQVIVVVAPWFYGKEWNRVLNWVQNNKGNGLATYVKSKHALINLQAVRKGDLDHCFIKNV